jgi:RNA polymerase sigma factor (sigma-70 family)
VENATHTPSDYAKGATEAPNKGPRNVSDRQLMNAVAQGEETAFGELYQRHGTAIFNYLFRLIHEEALAEDLLQETFVAIWKGAHSFRGKSKAKTWMFGIAHNKAVSWLRRNRPDSLHEGQTAPGIEPNPETTSIINWRNRELLTALNSLSPNHRAVIELVFVQEMAYADIAKVMHCPLGTVKSRVSYALRHLNGLLDEADFE